MSAPVARRLCAVLVLLSAPPALAATTIPEIVVTPNYTPTPSDQVGSTVSVIDARRIAASSQASVAALLRTVPGVTVIESGGPGGSTEVRLRGAETGHTVVLVDGVRVNDPATARGDFDFVMVPLGDIERIEVLRGPQSAIYGSDAIGGVVNIITRRQKARSSLSAAVERGSYGTLSERVAGGMTRGDFSLRYSGAHLSSEGFSRRGIRDENEPDGVDKTSGSFALSYAPLDATHFEVSTTATHELADYDAMSGAGADAKNTAERTQLSGYAKATLPTWNGWLDQSLTLSGMRSDRTNREPGGSLPVSKYTSSDVAAEYQATADLATAGTLTVGARAEFQQAQNEAATVTAFPGYGSDRTYFAGYAQHQIAVGNDLHLTFSGRYDGEVGGEGFLTGRAAAAYNVPDTGTTLRASIGTGAKRPTAYQIGNNLFAATLAAPDPVPLDLKAERSVGGDVGIEQTLFGGLVHISATAFYNRFQNLLGFTFLPDLVNGYYDNTDRAESYGLELAVDTVILPDVLTANATYTWMPTRNLATGRPLPRRPENSASFTVSWTPDPRWDIDFTGTIVGSRTNLASSTTLLAGYWKLDLAASYALSDAVKLTGRIENLTNNTYQDPPGYNAAGVSAYVGLAWNH